MPGANLPGVLYFCLNLGFARHKVIVMIIIFLSRNAGDG